MRSLDGVGTGIKLQHDEPIFPKQIDSLNSYEIRILWGLAIAFAIHSVDRKA